MGKFKQLISGSVSGIYQDSDRFHGAFGKLRFPSFKLYCESDSLKTKLLSMVSLAVIALFAYLQPLSVQNTEALDNIATSLGWRTANNGAENHGVDIIPWRNSTKGFNSWDRNQRYRIGSIIFHGVSVPAGWTEIREIGSNGIVHNGYAESYPGNKADTRVTINQFPFQYNNSQLIADLTYGKWYLSPGQYNTTSSCPQNAACYFFAFEPNITKINKLRDGQTITVSIRQQFQWQEGNQRKTANPEWKTISLTIKAAELNFSWNDHNTKIIELDSVPGNEIHGTVNELSYPWSGIWYVRRNVYEIKTGERSRQADHAKTGPCQNETSDVFRYGTNFRLGTWFFAADGKKFCFKPKPDALNHLEPGEVLESGMALSVRHWKVGILTSDQVTVRLSKPGIVLNIANNSISNTNSAQYNNLEGTANVVHTLDNNSTVEVTAVGPVNGTPETRTPVASNINVGYPSQAIGLDFDYGTWYWSDAEDRFEFRPNTNAINNLIGNTTVETKLIVKLMRGGQQIGETKEVAVSIVGRALPELTIRAKENQGTVNEAASATATYIITSSTQPTSNMIESVNLQASSNGGSSFLAGGVATLTLTSDLDFSSATQSPYEIEYSVSIEDDQVDEVDGEILLTIQSGANYSVGSSSSATVSVADNDVPVISIVGGTSTEGTGDSAAFSVSSDIERQGIDLEVNYSASQGNHDYINPSLLGNTSVTLAQGDASVTTIISFPIIDDENKEPTGQITVTLATGNGYTLATQTSATVNVNDDDILPILQIADATATTAGENIQFVVTASFQPNLPLTVNFQFDDNDAGFLEDGQSSPQQLTFTNRRANLTLRTVRSVTQESGTIDVSLRDEETPSTYRVTSLFKRNAEGSVLNAVVIKPILAIENVSTLTTELEVTEGGDAQFQITTTNNPGTLTVSYTLRNVVGSFLSLTPDVPQTFRARFTGVGSVFASTLIIETAIIDGINSDGQISVTLNQTAEYDVDQTKSTISFTVVNKPILSIESISTSVSEGNNAEVRISSNRNPGTLNVSYTPRNVTGSFLSLTPDVPHTFSTSFTSQGSDFIATLVVETVRVDGINSVGQISVTLNQTAEYDVNQAKSTTSFAIVDSPVANKPILSIESISTLVTEGTNAVARISSNVDPGTLNVSYTPKNVTGSFLSLTPNVPHTFSTSFTGQGSDFIATLVIKTVRIDGINSFGQISIELNQTADYDVNQAKSTTSFVIVDNPVVNNPVLSITRISTKVNEGSDIQFRISTSSDPGKLTVSYTARNITGSFLSMTSGVPQTYEATFTLENSLYYSTLVIGTSEVSGVNPTGQILVTLNQTADYDVDQNNETVIVIVEDTTVIVPVSPPPITPPTGVMPEISISYEDTSNPTTFVKGNTLSFVVNSTVLVQDDLSIGLQIHQSDSFILWKVPNSITIDEGESSKRFTISTFDPGISSNSDGITISLLTGTGYTLDNNNKEVALTVSYTATTKPSTQYSVVSSVIRSILLKIPHHQSPTSINLDEIEIDPDAKQSVPTVFVEATTKAIKEGEPAIFVVRADRTVVAGLSIELEVTEKGSFITGTPDSSVNIPAGKASVQYSILTTDDEVAELDGTITVSVKGGPNYATKHNSGASLIISDEGDRIERQRQVSYANSQILTSMVDAIGSRVQENSIDRMRLAFSGKDETFLSLNGHSSIPGLVQLAGETLNEETYDWQTLLSDSTFSISSSANGTTIWGASNTGNFSRTAIENVQTGSENLLFWQVGTDVKLGDEFIVGLTRSATESELNHRWENQTNLHYDIHSYAFHPYFGWNQPDRSSKFFISSGVGEMQIGLEENHFDKMVLDGNFQSLGISGEQSIYKTRMSADALELKVEFDFMKSWLNVNGYNYASGLNTATWWTESALLGTYLRNFNGGVSVNSLASLSVRRDNSLLLDTVELIPRLDVQISSPSGITVDGRGSFNFHEDYDKNYGKLQMSIEYNREQDSLGLRTGLSANLIESLNSSNENNWTDRQVINFTEFGEASDSEIFGAHISYGIPILEGNSTLSPFGKYSIYDDSFHEIKIGSRFELMPAVGFEISGARSVKSGEVTDYDFQLDSDIRW